MTKTPKRPLTNAEIEEQMRESFEQNYERLCAEGSHALTPDTKESAWQQVLAYWRKLRHIAEAVTDTEVKLTLPEQTTPKGRKYTIEGVVDIVREQDKTVMYDIKTHDADYVRKNINLYEKQLNVYAHIWQNLRGQPLDETAIIATAFPPKIQDAFRLREEVIIERELAKWQPLVDIPLEQRHVDETIKEFADFVDAVEEKRFSAPTVEKLTEKVGQTNELFATRICRNCDARFSCSSYRNYVTLSSHKNEINFSQYFTDFGSDTEKSERITIVLSQTPPPQEVEEV